MGGLAITEDIQSLIEGAKNSPAIQKENALLVPNLDVRVIH